jgi:putative copper export protein
LWAVGGWGDVFVGRVRAGVSLRLAGALALFAATVVGRRPAAVPAAVGALLVLASYAVLGHASRTDPAWLATPSAVVHVAAVSVWAGGLVAVTLAAMKRRRAVAVPVVVGEFSDLAAVALASTVATGLVLSATTLDRMSDLWDTAYGHRLVVKLAIVAVVVLVGALHRFRTVPRLRRAASDDRASDSAAPFVRLAWVEILGFGAVLSATAWLVTGLA